MTERIAGIERRHELPIWVADKATSFFAREIAVGGLENLERVRRLSEENVPIIFMPNHLSNADAFAIDGSLKRAGFKDIADKLVFMLGMRLERNLMGKILFNKAFNIIIVWPPSLAPRNEKERRKKERINDLAKTSAQEALKHSLHLVIFPEATRSRNGQLMQGRPGVFAHISRETMIVPVGISGTEIILPPGKIIPKPAPVNVAIGDPINLGFLFNEFEESLDSIQRRKATGIIMGKIAELLPQQYQGVYR